MEEEDVIRWGKFFPGGVTMNVFFQSFIDSENWDKAKWRGTVFLHDPTGVSPPILGIQFTNIEIGKQIFKEWLERLGKIDAYEELRISIVEGEIPGERRGYSVHISSNTQKTEARARAEGATSNADYAVTIGRVNQMEPELNSPHLPNFKQGYQKHGRYYLIPVSPDMNPDFNLAIEKTEIHFRNVSDLTETDVDAVVLPEDYFDNDGTVH